ncbi:MAG: TonB-dependent receptor plug domain-containing protein [Bacteroidales bacterium]|nr:TonB-dependent receptor plug domain-containing protein [Bacteroidales bacterium]
MKTLWFLATGFLLVSLLLDSCGSSGRTVESPARDEQVNVGYGSTDKDNLTYSVASVKMEEQDASYSDMYEYLRGRVAGVTIGPDNSIRIRGNNSINSSNEPLILLDGVEIADLGAVSPNDVYSVDVLKDASSSIYGVRGANGVILITTKGAHHTKAAAAEARRQEKAARKAARKVQYDKK